jgi:hypothetical protein
MTSPSNPAERMARTAAMTFSGLFWSSASSRNRLRALSA